MGSSSSSDSEEDFRNHPHHHQKKMGKKLKKQKKQEEKMQRKSGYYSASNTSTQAQAQMGKSLLLNATQPVYAEPVYYAKPITDPQPKNHIPVASLAPPVPQPPGNNSRTLRVLKDHFVDESDPRFAYHDIISVRAGEIVQLLDGSLERGLKAPYSDYILIKRGDGKIGKVGRLIFT